MEPIWFQFVICNRQKDLAETSMDVASSMKWSRGLTPGFHLLRRQDKKKAIWALPLPPASPGERYLGSFP